MTVPQVRKQLLIVQVSAHQQQKVTEKFLTHSHPSLSAASNVHICICENTLTVHR
jgi:hypothetical protein